LTEPVRKFTDPKKKRETSVQQRFNQDLIESVLANQFYSQATQIQLLPQKTNGVEEWAMGGVESLDEKYRFANPLTSCYKSDTSTSV